MDYIVNVVDKFYSDNREDDIFDRLTYKITPLLLMIAVAVNTTALYMGNIIECFTKAEFRGGWVQYVKDYCFVENTYFLRPEEADNMPLSFRSERYIAYYQWVPFILALQAFSFYLPHTVFRSFNWITGYYVYSVVITASRNSLDPGDKRKKAITQIANVLYRASRVKHYWLHFFKGQNFVTIMYFTMKVCNLILTCIHMYIFKIFIGNFLFALDVLRHGVQWRSSGLFPRVTLCDMQILRFGAPLNYTMECVLPLNMMNEKIFVFFYFWMILLFFLNLISIWIWFSRMLSRHTFFNHLLTSFTADDADWRKNTASSPDGHSSEYPLLNSDKHGVTRRNLDYGWDMRLVLGMIKEHAGLIFTSSVFREVNRLVKMRFLLLGLALFLFALTHAAPGNGKGTIFDKLSEIAEKLKDKDAIADKLAEIKDKIKNKKMKINDALRQAKGRWMDLSDDAFDAAVSEFHIPIKDNTDKATKKIKFAKNLEKAQELSTRNNNAFFGVTPFSFMDFDEFKHNFTMKPMSTDELPKGNAQKFGNSRRKRQATTVDLRANNAVGDVRNQGQCGSCWSFATVTTMETSHFKKTGQLLDLAEQQFVNCDTNNNGCNGGWMSTAYTYAKTNGIPQESTNPYQAAESTCTAPTGTVVKVSNYYQLYPSDTTSMMNAIDQGYSLAIALKAGTEDFMYYNDGILENNIECTDNTIDHGVAIVGYGTSDGIPYWIVRNSWGPYWGEDGYVRIRRGVNYCMMEQYPFFVNTV